MSGTAGGAGSAGGVMVAVAVPSAGGVALGWLKSLLLVPDGSAVTPVAWGPVSVGGAGGAGLAPAVDADSVVLVGAAVSIGTTGAAGAAVDASAPLAAGAGASTGGSGGVAALALPSPGSTGAAGSC